MLTRSAWNGNKIWALIGNSEGSPKNTVIYVLKLSKMDSSIRDDLYQILKSPDFLYICSSSPVSSSISHNRSTQKENQHSVNAWRDADNPSLLSNSEQFPHPKLQLASYIYMWLCSIHYQRHHWYNQTPCMVMLYPFFSGGVCAQLIPSEKSIFLHLQAKANRIFLFIIIPPISFDHIIKTRLSLWILLFLLLNLGWID